MINDEIRATRQRLGLTQGQLAERFGVALNTVSRWENGTSTPEGAGTIRLALRQLEQEYLLDTSGLEQEMQNRIELLQKSKRELEDMVKQQLAA